MAVSSKSNEPTTTDAARESAQPKVGAQTPDSTVASPDAQAAAAAASAAPAADEVAMVSRDVNGDPAQSVNYRVLVADDADEQAKDAAHNKAGEALGAKHADASTTSEAAPVDEEKRSKAEADELRRINFGERR